MSVERKTWLSVLAGVLAALASAAVLSGLDGGVRLTGWWALGLFVLTLTATPAQRGLRALGRNEAAVIVLRARRGLGVGAALVATYHLLETLEHYFGSAALPSVLDAALTQPWLRHGALALGASWLLAATSIRALSARTRAWSALHRLAYPIALLGALHATFAPHATLAPPAVAVVTLGLLVARLIPMRRRAADEESTPRADPLPGRASEANLPP